MSVNEVTVAQRLDSSHRNDRMATTANVVVISAGKGRSAV
jgi:hypothetical protein